MRKPILCISAAVMVEKALAETFDYRFKSDCHADGLEAAAEELAEEPGFLQLGDDAGAGNPPPMTDGHIFKSFEDGAQCIKDCYVGPWWNPHGGCAVGECNADRFAYCDSGTSHCLCPDGMCAVAEGNDKKDLTCQIERTREECPPGSGIFWLMEHIEVEHDPSDNSCTFTKVTGIPMTYDAVAWSDNPNLRDLTWHTIGKNADRYMGFTNDPIADSVEEPIKHGTFVYMNVLDQFSGRGLIGEVGGHVSTVRMNIVKAKETHFEFEGREWGVQTGNSDVAANMHAIMWIKQRCGKLKITGVVLDVPCILGDWSSWGACHPDPDVPNAKSCGPGKQERFRTIKQNGTYGKECTDDLSESQSCDQGCCPVDCVLSKWSEWGDCSEECGGGIATRTRTVETDMSCGGTACGDLEEKENCNFWVECNETDCEWTEWGDYGPCSAKCNGGTQSRSRSILKESKEGGIQCKQEDATYVQTCNTQACTPIDCEWSDWGSWGACSAQCNGGDRSRTRTVTTEAIWNGAVCDEASEESEECNVQPCSDSWTAGDGAHIKVDGVTFVGDADNSVVTSQLGAISIAVRNKFVTGSVSVGLATDDAPNFDQGQKIDLPYDGVDDNDILTIGAQNGRAKLFVNNKQDSATDLGPIGSGLLAKVILSQGSSIRVDGITLDPTATAFVSAVADVPQQTKTNVQSWVFLVATGTAAMVGMVAAFAWHQQRPQAEVQQPLLN